MGLSVKSQSFCYKAGKEVKLWLFPGEEKMEKIRIGDRLVGPGEPTFIVAEIGINHNGDVRIAKQLIDVAVDAGADAVKFQKRTIEVVYSPEELARPRESPFGTTNGDLKRALEFGYDEYEAIDDYCRKRGIVWLASCWDEGSVDFIDQFAPPCYKIASPSLTDDNLLLHTRSKGKPIILSTGMSTIEQIRHAVEVLGREALILLHCTSTYPSPIEELNLAVIPRLREMFEVPIGYSGHEVGVSPSVMAVVAFGACMVERHITLDRAMWGSDHAASLEPRGLQILVRDVRLWPVVRGDGIKRVYDSEVPIRRKLRRV
jgi:N-acetylneuraminate synthase